MKNISSEEDKDESEGIDEEYIWKTVSEEKQKNQQTKDETVEATCQSKIKKGKREHWYYGAL